MEEEDGKIIEKKGKGFQDKEYSSYYWVWQNQGNEIRTATNPFTGKTASGQPLHGNRPKGYAGYIGLKGHATDVEHIYIFISNKGNWKDRSVGKARFI